MEEHLTASRSGTVLTEYYKLVESAHGHMIINVNDVGVGGVIAREGVWVPEEIELLRPYMTGICVDVGAAIGTHTLEMAKTAAAVIAFEPNPTCYFNLCAHLLLNHVFNVEPIKAALGNMDGSIAGTVFDPRGEMYSSGGPAIGEGGFKFRIVTFDQLNIHPVSLVKIDVEGYEIEVLKGMRKTLESDNPVLYVEFHSEALYEEGCAMLRDLRYRGKVVVVIHEKGNEEHVLCQGVLFIRQEVVT